MLLCVLSGRKVLNVGLVDDQAKMTMAVSKLRGTLGGPCSRHPLVHSTGGFASQIARLHATSSTAAQDPAPPLVAADLPLPPDPSEPSVSLEQLNQLIKVEGNPLLRELLATIARNM